MEDWSRRYKIAGFEHGGRGQRTKGHALLERQGNRFFTEASRKEPALLIGALILAQKDLG